jgi:hypothetical protein
MIIIICTSEFLYVEERKVQSEVHGPVTEQAVCCIRNEQQLRTLQKYPDMVGGKDETIPVTDCGCL